jgi:hypothetical protein
LKNDLKNRQKTAIFVKLKNLNMLNKFTTADKLLFVAALLSLVFSEILYFNGYKEDGMFIGLWVPSILAFGIYLNLIKRN